MKKIMHITCSIIVVLLAIATHFCAPASIGF
jgi:hypothetical protein